MKANEPTALEKNGWKIGSAEDFLELSPDERAFVEAKLEKSHAGEVARSVGSSQPRVAKMEAADSSVTVDLIMRSLFAIGATPKDLARSLRTP